MMGGAIKARVEELTAPTNEMKRSSLGIAAAKATVKKGGSNISICQFFFKE